MSATETFSPGELVHARGREWIVLGVGEALRLRPLTGSEQEAETLIPELEAEPVTYAAFDPPAGDRPGGREAAQLLRDALRLSLRRGAGPFRGAGKINFEPRAYQLAPLMMALRQETARLLIADDVGIGKRSRRASFFASISIAARSTGSRSCAHRISSTSGRPSSKPSSRSPQRR